MAHWLGPWETANTVPATRKCLTLTEKVNISSLTGDLYDRIRLNIKMNFKKSKYLSETIGAITPLVCFCFSLESEDDWWILYFIFRTTFYNYE